MTRERIVLTLILGGCTVCAGARAGFAGSPANPYLENVTNRNVFRLTSPKLESAPPEPPKPAFRVTLTGIMTILGKQQALMKVQRPAKAGQPSSDEAYILAVGEREGDLEVLEIDEAVGTVKVSNAGTIQVLSFADNGVKQSTTSPPNLAGLSLTPANPVASLNAGASVPVPLRRSVRLPFPK